MLAGIGAHADLKIYWGGMGFMSIDNFRFTDYRVVRAENEEDAVSKMVKKRFQRKDFKADFCVHEFDSCNLLRSKEKSGVDYPDFGLKIKEMLDDVTDCHSFDECPLQTYKFIR
jgi:hypothetical protein